jgi:ABC-type nickel/cobalt efflux system permease component RcnA
MNSARERTMIRLIHLVLSIPILGYLYGPVAAIPRAAWFTRWIAMPLVILTGLWLWLKPRVLRRIREAQKLRLAAHSAS